MCRNSTVCSELGVDPRQWSSRSPLPAKPWFDDAMDAFVDACAAAEAGDREAAILALKGTRDRELNAWFDVHAQNTGTFRARHFGREPKPEAVVLDPQRSVTRFERECFSRDGYRCRYCGVRVVPNAVTKRMEDLLGREHFDATTRSNEARHGIKLAFTAALDHVVPHSRGGRTEPGNLVTSCWACNYGKSDYTLAELGLEDPRDRQPVDTGWLGLGSFTNSHSPLRSD